jgi:hypothetical protein
MKTLKLSFVFFALLICSVSRAQYGYGGMGGSVRPMVAINSGDVAGLKGVTNVNIVYDYSKTGVGAFRNEGDYLKKKEDDFKKDPGKFDKFKASWYNSRKERFEPKFLEMFNKMGEKSGMRATNYSSDAPVTLKIETVFIEPGMNIGIARQPAYIDIECTFMDKNGKEIVKYFIKNSVGASAMGFDYDAGSRLVESYAKGAKMLMKDVNKKLKKLK